MNFSDFLFYVLTSICNLIEQLISFLFASDNRDFLICCITVLFSLIATLKTIQNNKRIRFFESYFENKTKAYNDFFRLLSYFQINTPDDYNSEKVAELLDALYRINLYSSDVCSEQAAILQTIVSQIDWTPGKYQQQMESLKKELQKSMKYFRKDIDLCTKFKFRALKTRFIMKLKSFFIFLRSVFWRS